MRTSLSWVVSGLCLLACSRADPAGPQGLLPVEVAGAPANPTMSSAEAVSPGLAGGGAAGALGPDGPTEVVVPPPPPPPAMQAAVPSASASAPAAPPAADSGMPIENPAVCPPAPDDASPDAALALAVVNNYRVPAGAGCATMISQINAAAAAHCKYYDSFMTDDMCIANPHLEVMGCAGFTGATPPERMKAAGYTSPGGGEVMAFVNSARGSVETWLNSIWHRIPIIDPWTTHLGYGNSTLCDTIDFGRGTTPAPATTVVVYPYDGQLNVPMAFDGQYEGPMPPAPPMGWPSSSPISISAQKILIALHTLTKDGDSTPIEHIWLDSAADVLSAEMRKQLTNVAFMYANQPFEANTKYRVKVHGTYLGGIVTKEWTFTTGSVAAWGRK